MNAKKKPQPITVPAGLSRGASGIKSPKLTADEAARLIAKPATAAR